MSRLSLGDVLITVGAVCAALAVGTVVYAAWAEQERAASAPAGPREALPTRADAAIQANTLATATLAVTPWPTPALPPPTLPPRSPRPTLAPARSVAARVYALVGIAAFDAAVPCWESTDAYRAARPIHLDPDLKPLVATPTHPSYPSGHSTLAGASSTVLAYLFPPSRRPTPRPERRPAASLMTPWRARSKRPWTCTVATC